MTSQKCLYRSVASIMVRRPSLVTGQKATVTTTTSLIDTDHHSLTRQPTHPLYLLVKKDRKHHAWQLPQGGIDAGETILQGALRELEEECGDEIEVRPVETTSSYCYQYRFPDEFIAKHKRSYIGAKVHFIRSDWLSGQCRPDNNEIIDFAWLSKSEIQEFVTPEYFNALHPLFKYPTGSPTL